MERSPSPPQCPATVTVRRNPPRKARATPASAIPLRQPLSSPSLSRDIFSGGRPRNPKNADTSNPKPAPNSLSENLKVFLRIRPLTVQKHSKNAAESKNAWPRNPKARSHNQRPKTNKISELCVQVNEDLRSVTISTPQALQETKRVKSEVHEGFSHVFGSDDSQSVVFEEMVKPLVDDFLKGKSGMLAALGPSGSGKTHTVFGCAREPGMVPLAFHRILSENRICGRIFYVSMFEISSENGKAERMIDLLHDGGEICMQHSVLKGLQEVVVCDTQQAGSLIAQGMLKRATAMTNSNNQSSRSQCIINIRCDFGNDGEGVDGKARSSMLTIVDLAGAEREKKTGNQGARLHESNFINNTSMVFGLCLRSLLEHQKNRNKLLQKHYKNSLLTRYLKDFLEGKKRMMLILTVKPGAEDYLDTSFLLRQASPFTKIKFKTLEEPVNLTSNKRPYQAFPPVEQLKKLKFSKSEVSSINEGNTDRGFLLKGKGKAGKGARACLNPNFEDISDENLDEESSMQVDYSKMKAEKNREYYIMQGLSKALLTVLKEYKTNLKGVETENCHLRHSLINEKERSLDLENKLASERKKLFDLENELMELKSRCVCRVVSTVADSVLLHESSFNISQCQGVELQEVNVEVSPYFLKQLVESEDEEKIVHSAIDSVVTSASFSGGIDQYLQLQKFDDILKRNDYYEEEKVITDMSSMDVLVQSQEYSRSTKNAEDLNSYEIKGKEDIPSRSEANSESSTSLYRNNKSEKDAVNTCREDVMNLEAESVCVSEESCQDTVNECESTQCSQKYEFVKDSEEEPTPLKDDAADDGLSLAEDQIVDVTSNSKTVTKSSESPQKDDISSGDVKNLDASVCVSEGSHNDTSDECQSSKCIQDYEYVEDTEEVPTQLEYYVSDDGLSLVEDQIAFVSSNSRTIIKSSESPQKDDIRDISLVVSVNINEGDVKNLAAESVSVSEGSYHDTSHECQSSKCSQDYEYVEDTEEEPTQLEFGVADDDLSLAEDQIDSVTSNSKTIINSSESPKKAAICFPVDKERLNSEAQKVDPPIAVPPKEGRNADNITRLLPKHDPCSNVPNTQKLKRRLLPASSVLVKDINIFDINDENDKPKVGRGGKKVPKEDKIRTQGSLSLFNLLTK